MPDPEPHSLAARLCATPVLPPRQDAGKLIARDVLVDLDGATRKALEALLRHPPTTALVAGVISHSPFLASIIRRDPLILRDCLCAEPKAQLERWLEAARGTCANASSSDDVMSALRLMKRQAALLIALADCGGVWTVDEAVAAITLTADTAVQGAVDFILRKAIERGAYTPGDPANPGIGSGLIVLALGKHGAGELNYSSDIDIVLFYDPEIAEAAGIAEPSSFYVRLARDLSRILQERTADGYVFRVDLRLRPDPASTQAAVSTHTAYAYYESVGQNWERAAMIKARPMAGDIARGLSFLDELKPFIWRKYFDFAAIADIHAMKRQIQAVKGHEAIAVAGHDVKLGRGGIREIEFFVQTQQLVFGGRRPTLRGRRTLDMLQALTVEGWITETARDELSEAYRFLRTIEHRLQMRHDEQTQRLPVDDADLANFSRFAGYAGTSRFAATFTGYARQVEAHYALLFEDGPSLAAEAGTLSFTGADADPETLATLQRLGFRDAAQAAEIVRGWHFGRRSAVTSARAREALTELTPALLVAFGRSGDPDAALNALDNAFARLPAAVELLSILISHEALLALFATILGSAPRLARIVSTNPHVFDGVIDPAFTNAEIDKAAIHARIRSVVGEPPALEDALDRLRDAARQENFLIGARLLSGVYSPERAGLAYAKVADGVIAVALDAARRDLVLAHGDIPDLAMTILGLGRLGTRDLTASSDLDLVIIYDAPDLEVRSGGDRPLDAVTWAQRLAQRLVTTLTVPTRRGTLYDVDLRLRPSGGKGPLAVRLSGFRDYQTFEAELWEHMVLTKARVVAGDVALGGSAMAIVHDVLTRRRVPAEVGKAVRAMRAMIADAKGDRQIWDLKLVAGGLTDIDFAAEALTLAHAADHHGLLGSDVGAILAGAAAAGLISPADAETLRAAYRLFNDVIHWQRLTIDGEFDPATVPAPVMRLISRSANAPDEKVLASLLNETFADVRAVFTRVVA
ncbi:MAG: bifunctional [glutamine synthetase] adenylyltransferase/[glutamine synthetase]-adenylyl-L-tyrosine phosphorylase [Bosea sp. (in: a-proteobacteria)]